VTGQAVERRPPRTRRRALLLSESGRLSMTGHIRDTDGAGRAAVTMASPAPVIPEDRRGRLTGPRRGCSIAAVSKSPSIAQCRRIRAGHSYRDTSAAPTHGAVRHVRDRRSTRKCAAAPSDAGSSLQAVSPAAFVTQGQLTSASGSARLRYVSTSVRCPSCVIDRRV
jgi:hypothetical protein